MRKLKDPMGLLGSMTGYGGRPGAITRISNGSSGKNRAESVYWELPCHVAGGRVDEALISEAVESAARD